MRFHYVRKVLYTSTKPVATICRKKEVIAIRKKGILFRLIAALASLFLLGVIVLLRFDDSQVEVQSEQLRLWYVEDDYFTALLKQAQEADILSGTGKSLIIKCFKNEEELAAALDLERPEMLYCAGGTAEALSKNGSLKKLSLFLGDTPEAYNRLSGNEAFENGEYFPLKLEAEALVFNSEKLGPDFSFEIINAILNEDTAGTEAESPIEELSVENAAELPSDIPAEVTTETASDASVDTGAEVNADTVAETPVVMENEETEGASEEIIEEVPAEEEPLLPLFACESYYGLFDALCFTAPVQLSTDRFVNSENESFVSAYNTLAELVISNRLYSGVLEPVQALAAGECLSCAISTGSFDFSELPGGLCVSVPRCADTVLTGSFGIAVTAENEASAISCVAVIRELISLAAYPDSFFPIGPDCGAEPDDRITFLLKGYTPGEKDLSQRFDLEITRMLSILSE